MECNNKKDFLYSRRWSVEKIVLFLFFFFILLEIYSQTPTESDTTSNQITYTDSSFTDDSIRVDVDDETLSNSNSLYDTIRKKAGKYTWTKKLHDLLIVQDPKKISFDEREIDEVFNPFEEHHGKIIDSITIRQLDVFGPSLS
ncbi:MAG: hypothetical protein ACQESJ_07085, partial [Bacteroidota bacterium]